MSDQYPQNDPTQAYSQQPQAAAYRATPTTMSPEDERTWGAISHAGAVVAMICSAGFLGFLASIAVYVIHKDRGPFVRAHAANSINIQISMFVWLVVVSVLYVILGIVTLGIGFFVFLPVFAVPFVIAGVLHVIGAVKAYNGEWWNPPMTPQLVR
jgi:uncharacterized Tic20 family protein